MKMSRNDLIIAINNLYDENVDLKIKNEFLESQLKDKSETTEIINKDESEIINKIIEYGKEKLFDEVIKNGYGSNVRVWEDEETKEIKTTSLNQWLDNKIYTSHIPEYMSKEEIKNILHTEILELYDDERAKAMKEFEKSGRSDE